MGIYIGKMAPKPYNIMYKYENCGGGKAILSQHKLEYHNFRYVMKTPYRFSANIFPNFAIPK